MPPAPVRPDPAGAILAVWVVPGSRRPGVAGLHGGAVKIRVASPAERDRANRELLDILSVRFRCPTELVDGHRRRKKEVRLVGVTVDEAMSRLPP